MEYVQNEIYFYGIRGYRDKYLLVILRTAATKFPWALKRPYEGFSREEMLQVLAVMFACRSKHEAGRPRKEKLISSHSMTALIDKISIVSMSLLKVSENGQQQSRFALVSLPIINVLPDHSGELWTGDTAEIQFHLSHALHKKQ